MSTAGTIPNDTYPDRQASVDRVVSTASPRKRWLLVHPRNPARLLVEALSKPSLPLGLLMVATLAQHQFAVTLCDERIGDTLPEDFSAYDVVAITARTVNVTRAYQIADQAMAQGRRVILGGIHPTMLPEEARQHASTVVIGEIESVWDDLAADVQRDTLQPIYRAESLKPLTDIQHADFDLLRRPIRQRRYASRIPLVGTKGCPVGCTFCCTPQIYGKTYRTRTPEHIIAEIRYHQARMGRQKLHFSFMDDNISARSEFVEELFERMIGLNVTWNANISMNFLQKSHIPELARRAGCELLNIGFESLDPETIKQVGKGSNRIGMYDTVVANVHRQGIAIQGYFIFGLDTDTEASFQQTYDFIMRNRIDMPVFTLATPFPGTPWYDEIKPRLQHTDWDKYDVQHSVYAPANLDQERLLTNYIKLYREVFSWRGLRHRISWDKPAWIKLANVGIHFFAQGLKPQQFI
ncbi:MAG: radical SAM protein [Chloroflexales bacterium]